MIFSLRNIYTYSSCIFVILLLSAPCPALSALEEKLDSQLKIEALKRQPEFREGRVEIDYRNLDLSFLETEKGPVRFRVGFPENRRLAGKLVIPVDVMVSGNFREKLAISAVVHVLKPVATASRQIKSGEILQQEDLYMAEKDVSLLPLSFISDRAYALGRESKVIIPRGTVLLDWMLRRVSDIRAGDIVDLVKTGDGIRVQTSASAMEDGCPGKIIKVRNMDSGKVIPAKVKGSKEVEAI